MSNENKTIAWQAPEFRHYEKNLGWYVTLSGITVLIVGFFVVVQSDYFAAASLAILAILITLFARQKPQIVNIELSGRGIKFGNIMFPYKQLRYFWVVNNQTHKNVIFHTTAFLNNTVILELEDQNPDEVREFLLQHLPEHEETQETPVQKIMHKIKF